MTVRDEPERWSVAGSIGNVTEALETATGTESQRGTPGGDARRGGKVTIRRAARSAPFTAGCPGAGNREA